MPTFGAMTIKNVFDHYVKSLSSLYDGGEATAITNWILEEELGIVRAELSTRGEEQINEVKANDLAWKLMRLMKGEPVQYVLGYTFFHGLKLTVNKSVLIPRPETEELVEWILDDLKKVSPQGHGSTEKILDIGTGSGCIAIVLKKTFPEAEVYAMDVSERALNVARENAERNQSGINFYKDDILSPKSEIGNPKFEIIVSNPPYVLPSEKESLHKNVLDFEPHEALFVPEDDPLIFYKAILDFASINLAENGCLYFEVNTLYVQKLAKLLRAKKFQSVEVRNDLSGKERMVKASK